MEDEFVGKRRRSKVEAYYHIVWATKGRAERLMPDVELQVHSWLSGIAQDAGCTVLAIGGMPDHVHVVLRAPGKYSPSDLAKLLKGRTSLLLNDAFPSQDHPFRWQPGFGCFTLCRPHTRAAIRYVNNQKRHHANDGAPWPEWEETDEEVVE